MTTARFERTLHAFFVAATCFAFLAQATAAMAARSFEPGLGQSLTSHRGTSMVWSGDGTHMVYHYFAKLAGETEYVPPAIWQNSFRGGYWAGENLVLDGGEGIYSDPATGPAGLAYAPDEHAVLFVSKAMAPDQPAVISLKPLAHSKDGQVTTASDVIQGVLTAADLAPSLPTNGEVLYPTVTYLGEAGTGLPKLTVVVREAGTHALEGVYLMDIASDGTPNAASAVKLVGALSEAGTVSFPARLSADGDKLLLTHIASNTDSDLYLIEGIAAIVAGVPGAVPITSLSADPLNRVHAIVQDDHVAGFPAWSQDGSLVLYVDDVSGAFDLSDPVGTMAASNFDTFIAETADLLNDAPARVQFVTPQTSYFEPVPSNGGTRYAFTTNENNIVSARSLIVKDDLMLDASGVVQADFTLDDAAGTTLFIAAGTVVGNVPAPLPGPLTIRVYTPVTPVQEANLSTGDNSIPAVRDYGPDGLTFSPPAQLTYSYTDGELGLLIEDELGVKKYNEETEQYDIVLNVISRDLPNNKLVAELPTFSTVGVSGTIQKVQNKNQQKCIANVNKGVAKDAKAFGKHFRKCLKKATKGDLSSGLGWDGCSAEGAGDPTAGVKMLDPKGVAGAWQHCKELGDFGPRDVPMAAGEQEEALLRDVFGADLDAAMIASDADKIGAKCQDAVLNAYEKLAQAKLKAFVTCKKDGLKAEPPIDSRYGIEDCMDDMQSDPKSKVTKAAEKLVSQLENKCATTDLAVAFPGECAGAPGFTTCVAERIDCRLCLLLDDSDGLLRDCDAFDDSTVNASCP